MTKIDINELVSTTFYTIDRINKNWWKSGWDALLLYFEYIKKSRIDKTNQPRATDTYMIKWLWWWKWRFWNAKKVLQELWLIEKISRKDDKWKVVKWYVKVNFMIDTSQNDSYELNNPDFQKVDNPDSGDLETNALSNKLNALNTIQNTSQVFSEQNENVSLPKQEENKTTADLTFDKIYQNYYHKSWITKDEKASKKAFDKMWFTDEQKELILQDEKVFKVEWKIWTKLWTKIRKYRPWFDKYIQSLNIDDLQRDMRLKEIAKWHMDNADNQKEMEERYDLIIWILWEDLAKTFAKCCKEYIRNKNKITLKLV